jgi:hypothetical protein
MTFFSAVAEDCRGLEDVALADLGNPWKNVMQMWCDAAWGNTKKREGKRLFKHRPDYTASSHVRGAGPLCREVHEIRG